MHAALVVEVEIRPELVLYVHIEQLRSAQVHLIDFRFTCSMRKRHTRA
jgi:hypothetical protein